MSKIDLITAPIESDLLEVRKVFFELLDSKVKLVNIITRHLLKQKGKWLRPVLVLLSGRVCGDIKQETYIAGALIEMLHNATLIHDDVVDDATVRRGGPSLNAIWKTKIPILMGDFILAKSLEAATKLNNLQAIEILSNASARMSQGEIDQLIKSKSKNLSEENYFEIIGNKTAALLSACCQLGALTASNDQSNIEALGRYGENLGIAFQIQDDILDIKSDEKIFGKKKGTDIENGKITLPLIYAVQNVSTSEKKRILKMVKKKSPKKDVKFLIDFIEQNGGIERSEKKAKELAKLSANELADFKDSEYKTSLIDLTDFVINRDK